MPYGIGWSRSRGGNWFSGVWKKGAFIKGTQVFHYGEGIFGEIVDAANVRTGVTVYHEINLDKDKTGQDTDEIHTLLNGETSAGIYFGEYLGETRQGWGSLYFMDKSVYHGEWKKDKRHGEGSYFGVNREKYIGDWVNDRRDGYGEMFYENGDHYIGDWKADRMQGSGTHTSLDGHLREGKWSNNFFVSKLRDNKMLHDGINQNRVPDKKLPKRTSNIAPEMQRYLKNMKIQTISEDVLAQTKKLGL